MRPDLDLHMLVIAEEAPGGIQQADYENAVMADASKRVSGLQLLRKDYIEGGALFDYTGRSEGIDLEYYEGAFADRSHAFRVVAFGAPERMSAARTELESMIRSFRTRC
jgi:hypothetical protein